METKKVSMNDGAGGSEVVNASDLGPVDTSGVATKNFSQLNNSYSTLTGISMALVNDEYQSLKMQLPSTNDVQSLNGFNQISSTRLAFSYCNMFINSKNVSIFTSDTNEQLIQNLLDDIVDVDIQGNPEHTELYNHLLDIMTDVDQLIVDGNSANKKRKLLKLSCTAILASSYVTLI